MRRTHPTAPTTWGLFTTASDSASRNLGTGYLYCVYDRPVDPPPPPEELISGSSFEEPAATSWQLAYSYSDTALMPPGWSVESGNVDWGKYIAADHCDDDCAAEGSQQLDLCGVWNQQGQDQADSHRPHGLHELHAVGSCGSKTKQMDV